MNTKLIARKGTSHRKIAPTILPAEASNKPGPRRMRTWLVSAAAVSAVACTALWSGSTGVAQAAPTGCSQGGGGVYATAICSAGNGSYQAYATCMNPTIPGATFYKFVEGPWKRAGSRETSTVICPLLYVVSNRGVGLRN